MQTPQGFQYRGLLSAYLSAGSAAAKATDDAEIWAMAGGSISVVDGDRANVKITFPGGPAVNFRVGQGWDIHRLAPGRALMLGGVEVLPSDFGEVGHSDGDALFHAIVDAMLGARLRATSAAISRRPIRAGRTRRPAYSWNGPWRYSPRPAGGSST